VYESGHRVQRVVLVTSIVGALSVVGALLGAVPTADAANRKRPLCNGVVNARGCPSYQRIPVFSVSGAPLKLGFVDDVLLTKPGRYAIERYRLVGARPNTTYQVRLLAHINTPFCTGTPFNQPSSTFTTNSRGNGTAHVVAPGPTPDNPGGPPPAPAVNNLQNSFIWQFVQASTVDYMSNCIPVFENPPVEKRDIFFTWPPRSVIRSLLRLR
jgi:hypothetical protein